MNIAYCLPKLTGGADLLQQKQIATGLQTRGHKLTFISSSSLFDTVCTDDLQKPNLARRTWSNSGWFNFTRKAVWQAEKSISFPYLNIFSNYALMDACLQCLPGHDLVHERNGLYRMGVAMACKRLKLPYLLFFDADDIFEHDFLGEPITGLLRRRAKQIIKYTLTAADGIITVSNATKGRLIKIWNVPEEKVVVFPNAVDVNLFKPDFNSRSRVRHNFGISDAPIIIYTGSFYRWHDVRTLIDAFSLILAKYPKAHLLLVGDGEQCQAMKQHAIQLGVDQALIFTGRVFQSEVPSLINAADIAVAPYPRMEQAWWGSSMKLFEYLATGVAVIASDIGEQVTQVINDGKNGLLVAPEDASALAAAIMRLFQDPDYRLCLGQQAREDAVMKYSWDIYLSRLEHVYDAVINRQPVYSI